jgi:hypothetical protein
VSSSRAPTRSVGRLRLEETQSRGLAAKAAPLQGDDRRCESVRDYLNERRPGTPTGRAIWLKPKCLRVRLPPWALVKAPSGSVGNGRPLRLRTRDAVGSSPTWATEMQLVLVEQPGVLATLSRWRSRVQIPPGTPSKIAARYANRQSGHDHAARGARNLGDLSVRFRPAPLEQQEQHASVGHWQAQVAVNHPPSGFAGSTPARRTQT